MPGPPRPTHFLSFPLSSPILAQRATEISATLLGAAPRPAGIDESLFVDPRSLHMTIGIMSLRKEPVNAHAAGGPDAQIGSVVGKKGPTNKTLEEAVALLQSCESGIRSLYRDLVGQHPSNGSSTEGGQAVKPIEAQFDRLATFQSDPTKVRVLYAEPKKADKGTDLLIELAENLRERFEWEGMLADKHQPLTLHCTIAKSSNRRNRPSKTPKPDYVPSSEEVSQQSTLDLPAESGDEVPQPKSVGPPADQASATPTKKKRSRPSRIPKHIPFDASLVLDPLSGGVTSLGSCAIDSVELCEMGRRDKNGRYVALARIGFT